jgi:hypothetical protein
VIEKNVTLPVEEIVRRRRKQRGASLVDVAGSMLDALVFPEEEERMRNYKSHYGEFSSTQPHAVKNLGSVEGLSQIMRRTVDEQS